MFRVIFSKNFIKAARRLEHSGKFKQKEVDDVLILLASECSVPAIYRDHSLKGDLLGLRECHVRGDILLIYRKDYDTIILLAINIGTHHD
ncbi:MAG: type II toxin-antitoxin system mRNA interferase toxin, RelE/StbE family, partial [Patescibacteria group bacterium]